MGRECFRPLSAVINGVDGWVGVISIGFPVFLSLNVSAARSFSFVLVGILTDFLCRPSIARRLDAGVTVACRYFLSRARVNMGRFCSLILEARLAINCLVRFVEGALRLQLSSYVVSVFLSARVNVGHAAPLAEYCDGVVRYDVNCAVLNGRLSYGVCRFLSYFKC